MNEAPKDSAGQPPQKKGFWRRLFTWRALRRALIGLLILITFIGLLVTEENWRGKHALDSYQHEWEAKGERFDWQAFAPLTVPDEQNFLAAPIFINMLNDKTILDAYPKSEGAYEYGDWQKNLLTDLKPWQMAYRQLHEDNNRKPFPVTPQPQTPAAGVLFALGKFDPQVEELRRASLRPYAYIPAHYEEGIIVAATEQFPYLEILKRCSRLLQLRATAELADGESSKALEDIKLLLRVNDSLRNSPLLISQLVRMAVINIGLQPVWEGLAEHKWSDEQLAVLEADLAKEDFLADYEFAIRGERTFAISTFEDMRRTGKMIVSGGTW
jgi:hypothetical protein